MSQVPAVPRGWPISSGRASLWLAVIGFLSLFVLGSLASMAFGITAVVAGILAIAGIGKKAGTSNRGMGLAGIFIGGLTLLMLPAMLATRSASQSVMPVDQADVDNVDLTAIGNEFVDRFEAIDKKKQHRQ